MGDHRMISKKVCESARFLRLPATSQALYMHLILNADDDGIVEAYGVMRLINACEDDLNILISRHFVTILDKDDLITYIDDWLQHNKIRPDRKQDSRYLPLLLQVLPDTQYVQARPRADRDGNKTNKTGRKYNYGELEALLLQTRPND